MLCSSTRSVGPQFFRTLMGVVLALVTVAALAGPGTREGTGLVLIGSVVLAFCGSIVWTLGRTRAGQTVAGLLLVLLVWNLVSIALDARNSAGGPMALAGAVASAMLLGTMMAAMLLGHSYLVSPTMAIDPLQRLVALVGWSLVARTLLAGAGLVDLVRSSGMSTVFREFDTLWWSLLTARWVIGLVGPAVITWMAWQTSKIRSTQSATGILYAGVGLTFLGELTSQILTAQAGFAL
ncbi:MAG: hypothetical protein HY000_33950 [Planctomycetes bacterium]|nr:hypothetical protein [Planctomycetota bacterium]